MPEVSESSMFSFFTDLPKCFETITLRLDLLQHPGRDAEYDDVFVHTKGETDPDRP
jgi:hypothetical protein